MPDPFLILGVDSDADDAAVEAAYRAAIKRHPPDRDPIAFQTVREAYDRVRTRHLRVAYRLFDTEPPEPTDILRRATRQRPSESGGARPGPELFAALLRGED